MEIRTNVYNKKLQVFHFYILFGKRIHKIHYETLKLTLYAKFQKYCKNMCEKCILFGRKYFCYF